MGAQVLLGEESPALVALVLAVHLVGEDDHVVYNHHVVLFEEGHDNSLKIRHRIFYKIQLKRYYFLVGN